MIEKIILGPESQIYKEWFSKNQKQKVSQVKTAKRYFVKKVCLIFFFISASAIHDSGLLKI